MDWVGAGKPVLIDGEGGCSIITPKEFGGGDGYIETGARPVMFKPIPSCFVVMANNIFE